MTTVTRNGSQLLTAVLGGVLSGCVHIEHYPQSWGPAHAGAATDCTSVVATYANEGESSSGNSVLLATWIKPRQYKTRAEEAAYDSDLTKAQTVQLRLAANVLTVAATGANIHREWSFDSNKREFECKRGVIRIHRIEMENDLLFGVSKGTEDLFRVADHLIVRSHGGGVGFALIVPVGGYGVSWGRFTVAPGPAGESGVGAEHTP